MSNPFGNFITPAPKMRPLLNLGCLFDIPTGRYFKGRRGESILSGGLAPATGVGGRGNTFKSTLAHFKALRVMDRYGRINGIIYDAEPPSISSIRFQQLSRWMPKIGGHDLEKDGRLLFTDSTVMLGNEWFAGIKAFAEDKVSKDKIKANTATLPFIDEETGKNHTCLIPTICECDSFSMMPIESVEKIYNANEIGESGMNVEAMKASAAKNQMLMQLPNLTGGKGMYMILTAHAGDEIKMDQYAPSTKKLHFLKNGLKFKQVPEKFTFLTNNLWLTLGASVMLNKNSRTPEFPRGPEDNLENDPDLQLVNLMNLRAKTGPTGLPFELIFSQREGLLVGLSEFWFCKTNDGYGLGGHDRAYYLELVPEITMQRTTVRGKIAESPKLQRALEITSEMCQMSLLWHDMEEGLLCTPKELYEGLKAKGYDWELLLNTRGHWVFEEDAPQELPFLSTMDLLNMQRGTYHPYWYPVKKEELQKK